MSKEDTRQSDGQDEIDEIAALEELVTGLEELGILIGDRRKFAAARAVESWGHVDPQDQKNLRFLRLAYLIELATLTGEDDDTVFRDLSFLSDPNKPTREVQAVQGYVSERSLEGFVASFPVLALTSALDAPHIPIDPMIYKVTADNKVEPTGEKLKPGRSNKLGITVVLGKTTPYLRCWDVTQFPV